MSFRLPDYIINSFIGLLFFSLGRLSVSLFNSDKIVYLATAIYTVLVFSCLVLSILGQVSPCKVNSGYGS